MDRLIAIGHISLESKQPHRSEDCARKLRTPPTPGL